MIRLAMPRIIGLALCFVGASDLVAQGAIATQGFGYPTGQLTVRASSTGGAMNDFDQAGPHNPAALLNWGVAGAYLQYSPERRSTTIGGVSKSATVARFPVFAIGLPAGQRYGFGLSSSSLLERNFTTVTTARQLIRSDSVTTTSSEVASGGINDVQFGAARQMRPWLRIGTALHVITGENRVRTTRTIVPDTGVRFDTVSYGGISELSTLTFGGTAVSFGVEVAPTKKLSIAGSARLGFGMRADVNDSTQLKADVPSRAGASVKWEVAGVNLAARYNWEGWSAMKGLGAARNGVFDTNEIGVGAEVAGPRIRGGQMLLRVGARTRDLPFGVNGTQASENVLGGGLGFPLAFGRAQLDLGVERASRKVTGLNNVSERGLILSFGFRLRT